jgi:hypothetical protein
VATPTWQEEESGNATPTTNLTTDVPTSSALDGGSDQVYIALVGLRDGSDFRADTITGGGLTWTRLTKLRDTPTTLMAEWWYALGSPSTFTPTLDSFSIESGLTDTSLASVSWHVVRIDGANIGGAPVNASFTDAGVSDTSAASHTQTVTNPNSLIVSGLVTRNFTISATDSDYTVRGSDTAGAAGNVITTYIHTRSSAPPVGTDTISHTLSAAADWILGGVEVEEAAAAAVVTNGLLTVGVG